MLDPRKTRWHAPRLSRAPVLIMPLKMSRGLLASILAGLVAVIVVIWPPYLPTLDGPQQVYAAYLLKTWPALENWYDRSLPLASAGFPALFLPLSLLLPWMWAQRIALGLMAALWSFSTISLAKTLHPERIFIAVLGSTLVLGWALTMGFFSFIVGTALSIIGIAAALDTQESRKTAIKSQIFLSLAVMAHLFAGALGIAAVGLVYLFQEGSIREKLERLVYRIAVPAVLVLVFGVLTRQDVLPEGESVWLESSDRFISLSKMGFGGPLWRALPPTLLAIYAAIRCLMQAKKGIGDRREWGLAVMVLVCLVVALVAPLHLPGWMHFASRFVPLALLLGISLVPLERLPKQHFPLAGGAIAVFSLAAAIWFGDHFRKLSADVEPMLAVTRAPLKRNGPRLPVLSADPWFAGIGTMDVDFPFADPAFNIPLLIAVEQGGIVPYTFTTAKFIHPFVDRRDHPPLPKIPAREHFWLGLVDPEVKTKPELRHALLVDIAAQASRFEDVALFGPAEDQKVFDDLGFESAWRSDAGSIATFKGCPVTFGIKGSDEMPKKIQIAYGWFPVMKSIWSNVVTREGELTKVELPGAPCGPIWAEIRTEGAPFTCVGAQRDGRLIAFERTTQKAFLCTMAPVGQ